MFPKLWRLLKPFHRDFYKLVVMAIFIEAGGVLISYTVPLIVNLLDLQVQFFVWMLVVIGMLAFNQGFVRLDNQYDWHIVARIWHAPFRALRLEALAKFFRLPLIWHQRHNSGALIGQVNDGVFKTVDLIAMVAWEFMPTSVQGAISLVPMIIHSPWVAFLSVLALVLFIWLTLVGEKARYQYRKDRQDVHEEDWNFSVSSVQAIETVVTFGLKKYLLGRFVQIQDKIVNLARKEHLLGIFTYNFWRINVLTTIRLAIYALWVIQYYQGTIDIPTLIFLSVLVERLFASYWRFARLADRVYGNSESITRLIKLLEESETIETGHQSVEITGPIGVTLESVCLAYQGEYLTENGALHDISLTFEPGKISALVGPSGAGKSTVVAALMKLFKIQRGLITVAGLDIDDWDTEKLLQLIAHVPPGDKVYLWDEPVSYNIRIGRPDATDGEVAVVAKHVGLHDFIMSLEKGYQTVIGERGVRLSSGQKQRLALARAILRGSPVVILDEPTSAVDACTEQLLQANLKHILVGKTAIIIAHRLSTIRDADKIFVLDGGRKIEEGTHQELLSRGGLYADMVTFQTAGEKL